MKLFSTSLLWVFAAGAAINLSGCASSSASQTGNACAGDIQKFCANVPSGGGRILECLKAHGADLSDGCKQAGEVAKQKITAFVQACGSDLQQFCANIPAGNGAKYNCLKENQSRLSQPCQSAIAQSGSGQ